jgi:hypothetical protein
MRDAPEAGNQHVTTVPLEYAAARTKTPRVAPVPIFYDTNFAVTWWYIACWSACGFTALQIHHWIEGVLGLSTAAGCALEFLRWRKRWNSIFKTTGFIVRHRGRARRIRNVQVEYFRRRFQRFEFKLHDGKNISIGYLHMSTPEIWRMEEVLRDRFKQCAKP